MITSRQKKNARISLTLLFRLTRRTILFLFLFLVVLILFFIIGNYQVFLDSSQKIILQTASFAATALSIISLAGMVETVFCIIQKKGKRFFFSIHLVLMTITLLAGIISLFALQTTEILSLGLN